MQCKITLITRLGHNINMYGYTPETLAGRQRDREIANMYRGQLAQKQRRIYRERQKDRQRDAGDQRDATCAERKNERRIQRRTDLEIRAISRLRVSSLEC